MNCKNCHNPLEKEAQFCTTCGAKVVVEKITFKKLFLEVFINAFGFDSKFFKTFKEMITQPHVVISDYLSGVRKRYMNPFAFFAVGAALSLIIFNYYADDFIAINSSMNTEQFNETKEIANMEIPKTATKEEAKKLLTQKKSAEFQLKLNHGMMQFMLHYYNLLAFVFLFLYAILSKWTFFKPHNLGEHIVINAYIFGLTNYFSIILFLLAIITNPSIYFYSLLVYIIYYMYCFGKLYKLSFGRNILKLLRFLFGLAVMFAIMLIFSVIIGGLMAAFNFIEL